MMMVKMWFLLLLVHIAHVQPVTSQSANRLILRNKEGNPCQGHVEVYTANEWGYVGTRKWSKEIEEVVCRSTHCGTPVDHSLEDTRIPDNSKFWFNELECKGNEASLWACPLPPGLGESKHHIPLVKQIQCSHNITFKLDGFRGHAGLVQYFINGEKAGYFCGDNWDKEQADLLCKTLQYGESKEIPPEPEWMKSKAFRDSEKMKIDCSNIKNVNDLWQCAVKKSSCQKPAAVICDAHETLQLGGDQSACSGQLEIKKDNQWELLKTTSTTSTSDEMCQQMHCGSAQSLRTGKNGTLQLKCTDQVKVVLTDNGKESSCYGEVNIKVNDTTKPVCASRWTQKEAEIVCKELKCGKLISNTVGPPRSRESSGIMDHVTCTGNEASLWHCPARRNEVSSCPSTASVVCSGSMKVELKDGPGECAGRLAIYHKSNWKRVDKKDWNDKYSNIVCKQRNCGNYRKTDKPEKFSQGSGDFLSIDCKSGTDNIEDIYGCLKGELRNQGVEAQREAVEITCDNHNVPFLNGTEACSGEVGIEQGSEIYWLSGSSETWTEETANTVCQQMHCGNVSHHDSKPSADTENDVRNCSFNKERRMFECNSTALPSDHNHTTTAYVHCAGNISMSLTNDCWGNVNFCMGGKCGGVCADTWNEDKSRMLCQNLDCGNGLLQPYRQSSQSNIKVNIKSLHATSRTRNLTQCNFVKYEDNDKSCTKGPVYVVCSGSVKPKFGISRDKCFGNLEVSYEGSWLPVCSTALQNTDTQNTICKELGCGDGVETLNYFGPTPTVDQAIGTLQCPNSDSLAACTVTSQRSQCQYGGLQCSEWRTVALEVDKACSGNVVVHSKRKGTVVSYQDLTLAEGETLCRDMQCGSYKSSAEKNSRDNKPVWDKSFICSSENPENIWKCENSTKPSTEKKLFIECHDEPVVTLSDKCHGKVEINNLPVCNADLDDKYWHEICQDQNCSNFVYAVKNEMNIDGYHVSCDKHHYKLQQCKRVQGRCKGPMSIYCVGDVAFSSTEPCGGQVLVQYAGKGGEGEKVCIEKGLSDNSKNQLCHMLNCGNHNASIKIPPEEQKKKEVDLQTSLVCNQPDQDIRFCAKKKNCKQVPAEIYCDGYKVKVKEKVKPPGPPVVSIIVGVGFVLVVVILIAVFVRFCIVKRTKKSNGSSKMLPRQDVEFESGDYQEVTSKPNEMQDLSRGRIRSEDQFITENDARSTSSFSYDEIDNVAEARPLTAADTSTTASGPDYINEDLHQSDGVTYEVDDPQNDYYDDIEAGPEIVQTEAEIHSIPTTAPECTSAAAGLVEKDEDYLVPGEDG